MKYNSINPSNDNDLITQEDLNRLKAIEEKSILTYTQPTSTMFDGLEIPRKEVKLPKSGIFEIIISHNTPISTKISSLAIILNNEQQSPFKDNDSNPKDKRPILDDDDRGFLTKLMSKLIKHT